MSDRELKNGPEKQAPDTTKEQLATKSHKSAPAPAAEIRDSRFVELDAQMKADESNKESTGPHSSRGPKPRQKKVRALGSLDSDVRNFVKLIGEKYPERLRRRPKALKKRVLSLIRVHHPPHPQPKGHPPSARITNATELYRRQRREIREGNRNAVNWVEIALAVDPTFRRICSEDRRRSELKRVRDAVYARRKRKRATAGQRAWPSPSKKR